MFCLSEPIEEKAPTSVVGEEVGTIENESTTLKKKEVKSLDSVSMKMAAQEGHAAGKSQPKEITPSKLVEEDCRVCDACSRVIDEMLAFGVSRRFGEGVAVAVASFVPGGGILVNRENVGSTYEEIAESYGLWILYKAPRKRRSDALRSWMTILPDELHSAVMKELGRLAAPEVDAKLFFEPSVLLNPLVNLSWVDSDKGWCLAAK
ncbi:Zinc finger FYVE domain-containing protein 16 [Phytophthora cinnamomi]|uniref:Zinc finger FYVE domain-containing protein 16 n=1 Tax=Phytophthora cinnamomi TaxID=4785 RepID=UPI00355937E5|nr:Zinc finger FYVE domain-containing protein 16 [Phytophthora cinnamomi]